MLLSASSAEPSGSGGCLQAKPYSVTLLLSHYGEPGRFPGRTPNPGRTGRDPLHPLPSQRSEGGIRRVSLFRLSGSAAAPAEEGNRPTKDGSLPVGSTLPNWQSPHPMALPPPPKCSCRSQAAHGFQRDMPSHLAYVWPSSTYYTAPSAAVPFRNRGGVVTRWQPKTASPRGSAACRTSSSVRRRRPRVVGGE